MTDRIQAAYLHARPNERRLFNHAIFERIWIDREDIARVQLADPFAEMLHDAPHSNTPDFERLAHRLDPTGDAWQTVSADEIAASGVRKPATPFQRSPVRTS